MLEAFRENTHLGTEGQFTDKATGLVREDYTNIFVENHNNSGQGVVRSKSSSAISKAAIICPTVMLPW